MLVCGRRAEESLQQSMQMSSSSRVLWCPTETVWRWFRPTQEQGGELPEGYRVTFFCLFNLRLWYFPSWEMWWKTCPSALTFKWIISAEQPNLRRSRRQLFSWRVLEYRRTCPLMQNHTRCTMMNNAHNKNCIYLNSSAAIGLVSCSDLDEMLLFLFRFTEFLNTGMAKLAWWCPFFMQNVNFDLSPNTLALV